MALYGRAHAQQEIFGAERYCQVIVAAHLQKTGLVRKFRACSKYHEGQIWNQVCNPPAKIAIRRVWVRYIEDYCRWGSLTKRDEAKGAIWYDVDGISFGGEESAKNLLQSAVAGHDYNPINCG